ncbi:NADH-quinone oxidoreductase subunit C [bacterium]|nr:NADH-quinone oxidoreductase subunit C [bacterium]
MLENATQVMVDNLVDAVAVHHPQGYRFVTITCTDLGDVCDLYYHFDKDYALYNLYLRFDKKRELPSISGIYPAAALIENELKDLFGLKVTGLALDYEGRFLLSDGAPHAPQGKPIPQRTVVAYPPPQEKGA